MHWHCTECNHQGRLERTQVYPGGGTIGVGTGVSLHPSYTPRNKDIVLSLTISNENNQICFYLKATYSGNCTS